MKTPRGATSYLITGGDVVLPDRVIRSGLVFVHDGAIRYAGPGDKPTPGKAGMPAVDATGLLVCPALWEPHIHGCAGTSTEKATPDSLQAMASFLAAQGVGAFMPTTVSDEAHVASLGTAMAELARSGRLDGRMPGMYVEGPFVEPSRKGGIPDDCVHPFSSDLLARIGDLSRGYLRVMTIAPELPGAEELMKALQARKVLPAFGHSAARYDQLAAFDSAGPVSVTHLYNAMSGVSHQQPGLAQWALLNKEAFTELIVDLVHVHPAAVALALRARPWERIVLISDAIAAAGVPDGAYTLYGKKLITRGNGLYYADSGVLVGSRALVRHGVVALVEQFGVSLPGAFAMASLNPARMLGIEHKGALLSGYDADIALFSKDLSRCELTLWKGAPIFEA